MSERSTGAIAPAKIVTNAGRSAADAASADRDATHLLSLAEQAAKLDEKAR